MTKLVVSTWISLHSVFDGIPVIGAPIVAGEGNAFFKEGMTTSGLTLI